MLRKGLGFRLNPKRQKPGPAHRQEVAGAASRGRPRLRLHHKPRHQRIVKPLVRHLQCSVTMFAIHFPDCSVAGKGLHKGLHQA